MRNGIDAFDFLNVEQTNVLAWSLGAMGENESSLNAMDLATFRSIPILQGDDGPSHRSRAFVRKGTHGSSESSVTRDMGEGSCIGDGKKAPRTWIGIETDPSDEGAIIKLLLVLHRHDDVICILKHWIQLRFGR